MDTFSKNLLIKVATKAQELAVLKWKDILANNGHIPPYYPEEIRTLKDGCNCDCSYCALFDYCANCPMREGEIVCADDRHIWCEWDKHDTWDNAKKVMDKINTITVEQIADKLEASLTNNEYVEERIPVMTSRSTTLCLSNFCLAFNIKE